jgi:hypothetical protein
MDELTGSAATLAILSAMITPAVLISACGSLTISTSNRLSRSIDRTRKLTEELEKFVELPADRVLAAERRALLFEELHYFKTRVHLLHRALACLYLTLGTFVGTSISIGVVQIFNDRYAWLPLLLGMTGGGLLFYSCILLVRETYVARTAILMETDFAWKLAQHFVPAELSERHNARKRLVFRHLFRKSRTT